MWMNNVERLMKLTGDKPLGFYETPVPKVRSVSINWKHVLERSCDLNRSLTPSMMKWAAESGRFVFHKDTSILTSTMIDKIKAVKSVNDTTTLK